MGFSILVNWHFNIKSTSGEWLSQIKLELVLLYLSRNVNTLRLRQYGHHFPDDIFQWIFLNENVWISITNSLKFVPKGPINNTPSLVQIMAIIWTNGGYITAADVLHSASMREDIECCRY